MTPAAANDYQKKYQQLIDAETWDYINSVNAAYPADAVDASIAQQRQFYDAMCERFFAPFPEQVTKTDGILKSSHNPQGIAVRHYQHIGRRHIGQQRMGQQHSGQQQTRQHMGQHTGQQHGNNSTTVLYLHGGGFVVGSLDSHDDICAELCLRCGLDVLAVDYRLSPEHRHPAALEDTMAAIRHLQTAGRSIILCGDSAGANLCAAASHRLSAQSATTSAAGTNPHLLGQILIYPGLGGNSQRGSYIEHQHAPMLTLADIKFYELVRVPERFLPMAAALQANNGGDKTANIDQQMSDLLADMGPLNNKNFANLPKTVAISAECDPLHDDGLHYCRAITRDGGSARFVSEKGLVHGYLRARHRVARAKISFSRIVDTINEFAVV